MSFNTLLTTALAKQSNSQSDSTCAPTQVAQDFYNLIPVGIRPYFRAPRGVQLEDGTYLGSIVQIAKGSLGRLHGPALELFTASMLQLLLEMDERSEEQKAENPLVIKYNGEEIQWDVRRYSSSQDKNGKWQSIPDYSIYFDTTQATMRDALAKERQAKEESSSSETQDSSSPSPGRVF